MLDRMDFDDYIWECFILVSQNEVFLFGPYDSPNRNPEQVPIELWCQLLKQHLNQFNYN